MILSTQQLKFLQQGSLLVGVLLIIFCFFFNNGVAFPDISQLTTNITYGGKLRSEVQGNIVMTDLECDQLEKQHSSMLSECLILKATHGLAITSIVFGSVALIVIILRDTILKTVYKANKQIGFVIILVLIFIPLLFTIMMPMWKIVNNDKYLTYKFFPVFLELISFSGYAIAFCIEMYQGLNKTQGGLLS